MGFFALQQRLIEIVRDRVANGVLTESQLARLTGFSQPHIHNVLKGVKVLKTELADEILRQMRMNVEDLVRSGLPGTPNCASVPLLTGLLGTGMSEFWPQRTHSCVLIPEDIAGEAQVPLAIRLGEDMAMCPQFAPGDLVMVDLAINPGREPARDGTCVVMTEDGPRLRYVYLTKHRLYYADAIGLRYPARWSSFPIRQLPTVLRARVVWQNRRAEPDYRD
jgi:hypothetical protein